MKTSKHPHKISIFQRSLDKLLLNNLPINVLVNGEHLLSAINRAITILVIKSSEHCPQLVLCWAIASQVYYHQDLSLLHCFSSSPNNCQSSISSKPASLQTQTPTETQKKNCIPTFIANILSFLFFFSCICSVVHLILFTFWYLTSNNNCSKKMVKLIMLYNSKE